MKVAMLSDCYPPRLGGIESQVRDLSRHLVAAGHEVEVFTATPGPGGERGGATERGDDGVTVHRHAWGVPGGIPVNPFAPPEIRRRLDAGGFDVAHAQLGVVSPFATDLVPVALEVGLPVAATFHCVMERSAVVFRAIGHLDRWARRGVALSAVSTMAAQRVSAAARGARVEVVPNGVDAAWWHPGGAATASAHHDGSVHVISAMRLVSRKRPLAMLRVLEQARAVLDPAVALRATIVGEGPQRRVMEHRLRARGLTWVQMPGRVDKDELRALHQGADVYLSAAQLEAFGIAALEAQAAGLPIVARRGTGTDDFVKDGVSGLLADSDAALAGALAHLAGERALREQMRAHLLASRPAQDWPGVITATLGEYRRAAVALR